MMKNTELKYGRIKPPLDAFSREEILEMAFDGMIGNKSLIMFSKLLIDAVGKEEAGKLVEKTRYEEMYVMGRAMAERLGNPQDLDSLLEAFKYKSAPWVGLGPLYYAYRTEKKATLRTSNFCFEAEAIKKVADKEMREWFARYFCIHDRAWSIGFNPKLRFKQTKSLLIGDDYCEFVFELD